MEKEAKNAISIEANETERECVKLRPDVTISVHVPLHVRRKKVYIWNSKICKSVFFFPRSQLRFLLLVT